MDKDAFNVELCQLINRHCVENGSDTPDFILRDYLVACLHAFESAMRHRRSWYRDADGEPLPSHPMFPNALRRE